MDQLSFISLERHEKFSTTLFQGKCYRYSNYNPVLTQGEKLLLR